MNVISESNDAFVAEILTHIYNYGGILAGGAFDAVKFDIDGDLFNGAGATISGGHAGVSANSQDTDPVAITNLGSILGGIGVAGDGIFVCGTAGTTTIDNRGYIFGGLNGIEFLAELRSKITNSGMIESNQDGILVDVPLGVTITNTGTISGHVKAIHSRHGEISLTNSGHLIGDVLLEPAKIDTIVNTGSIAGTLHLGGGSDVFLGSGGTSGEVFGEAGGDRLTGGSGIDFLAGGADGDFLTGGAGKDHFVFDTALAAAGIDRITDFKHLGDKIDLSHAVFTATNPTGILSAAMFFAGAAAHDASDRIIYKPANGWLIYDANGSHAGGATHFATLVAHLTLTNADFLVTA